MHQRDFFGGKSRDEIFPKRLTRSRFGFEAAAEEDAVAKVLRFGSDTGSFYFISVKK